MSSTTQIDKKIETIPGHLETSPRGAHSFLLTLPLRLSAFVHVNNQDNNSDFKNELMHPLIIFG